MPAVFFRSVQHGERHGRKQSRKGKAKLSPSPVLAWCGGFLAARLARPRLAAHERARRRRDPAIDRPIPDQCLEPIHLRRAGAKARRGSFMAGLDFRAAGDRQHSARGDGDLWPHDDAAQLEALAQRSHHRSLAHERPIFPP